MIFQLTLPNFVNILRAFSTNALEEAFGAMNIPNSAWIRAVCTWSAWRASAWEISTAPTSLKKFTLKLYEITEPFTKLDTCAGPFQCRCRAFCRAFTLMMDA